VSPASPLSTLALVGLLSGVSVASGLRLYATVAVVGFLGRIGALALPGALSVLADRRVIAVAALLYLVEFFADKIPYLDTIWDAVHTFVRVPASAVLAWAATSDVSEPWRTLAALLCGGVTLSAHGLKSSARVAINASPEPASNWIASFAEDGTVAVLLWLAVAHPVASVVAAGAVLLGAIWAFRFAARRLRRLFSRRAAA
jgi:uncharacterized protein DUF4126